MSDSERDAERPAEADRLSEAARSSALAHAAQGSIYQAVGGTWGIVSSVLPGALFVIVYTVLQELEPALVAALAAGALMMVVSLLRRKPFSQAVGGLVGVGVCALIAYRSGEAGDYYVMGFWTNAASIVLLLGSIALRWPLIGVLVGALSEKHAGWRENPVAMRILTLLTWGWAGLFALRLAVQLPFYFTDQVAVLGTLRLVMGLPLFALMLWFTWLVIRRLPASGAGEPGDEPPAAAS